MIRNKKKIYIFSLLLCGVAYLGYRLFFAEDEISYISEKVTHKTIEKVVNATGEVKAIELVTVGAQATGKIEKIYVTVGQKVKKGDMIAQIDSSTQANAVESNKAKLKSLEAQLNSAKISEKVAKKQFERMQKLRKNDAASEEDFENAENTYEANKAKVIELEASITETSIALNTAETNLGYTKITSPLDGTIVSLPVKVGQTVNAAMNTPTIVQIADLSQMEILIEISEGDIADIKPGNKVSYYILGDVNKLYETTLKTIDPGLTLLTNGSYSEVVGSNEAIYYYGRLIVPNDDEKLRIGMTTQTTIYVAEAKNVLSVPVLSIHKEGKQKYVNILSSDGIKQAFVKTGISDGINIEITDGLTEGEEVIIAQMSASEVSDKMEQIKRPRGF